MEESSQVDDVANKLKSISLRRWAASEKFGPCFFFYATSYENLVMGAVSVV